MLKDVNVSELMESTGVGFGTSGARGRVEAMTDPVCYAYTRAFLQALQLDAVIPAGAEVVLAGDLRASTPRILGACVRAVQDAGFKPVFAGFLPSPAVAYYAMQRGAASIMVTGSHIPDDRNGIKFNRPDGEILKHDEARIQAQTVPVPEPFPELADQPLPPLEDAAAQVYIDRYLDFFAPDCLTGLSVAVYEHSGVARDLLVTILERLGARVARLARSELFIPVDTEAIRAEDIELGRQWAADYDFDAIVSTDGDADRPLIADENGEWLRGDVVGVLCAHQLGIEALVTPVSSNTVVEASGWFARVYRTRIGSPYVIAQMNEVLGEAASVAGYEANGGVLLATDLHRDGRTLKALPTRDAVLPVIAVLVAAHGQHKTISALLTELPSRYTASDRIKNFPTAKSSARIHELAEARANIEQVFGGLCGPVRQTDNTDGLRMTFDNGEIVHLRPSGNAPELRCYNEADSPERAAELNRSCLEILAGWR